MPQGLRAGAEGPLVHAVQVEEGLRQVRLTSDVVRAAGGATSDPAADVDPSGGRPCHQGHQVLKGPPYLRRRVKQDEGWRSCVS